MRNFLLYAGDIVGSRESHPFLFSGPSSHSCFQAMVWKKHVLNKIGNVCYPPVTGYPCTVIMIPTKTHLQPFSVCAFAEAAVGTPPAPPRWLWPTLPVKYLEAVTDFQNERQCLHIPFTTDRCFSKVSMAICSSYQTKLYPSIVATLLNYFS